MPIVEISRNRDCESEKDSGREPARKDLDNSCESLTGFERFGGDLRNGHDGAQGEQHEEAVQHLRGRRRKRSWNGERAQSLGKLPKRGQQHMVIQFT